MRGPSDIPTRQRHLAPPGLCARPGGLRGPCGLTTAKRIARRRILIGPPPASPSNTPPRPADMRPNSRKRALGVAEDQPQAASPCLEITPSLDQYEQLCRDLKKLRRLGAPSHTAAILDAVHAAAEGHKLAGQE